MVIGEWEGEEGHVSTRTEALSRTIHRSTYIVQGTPAKCRQSDTTLRSISYMILYYYTCIHPLCFLIQIYRNSRHTFPQHSKALRNEMRACSPNQPASQTYASNHANAAQLQRRNSHHFSVLLCIAGHVACQCQCQWRCQLSERAR